MIGNDTVDMQTVADVFSVMYKAYSHLRGDLMPTPGWALDDEMISATGELIENPDFIEEMFNPSFLDQFCKECLQVIHVLYIRPIPVKVYEALDMYIRHIIKNKEQYPQQAVVKKMTDTWMMDKIKR